MLREVCGRALLSRERPIHCPVEGHRLGVGVVDPLRVVEVDVEPARLVREGELQQRHPLLREVLALVHHYRVVALAVGHRHLPDDGVDEALEVGRRRRPVAAWRPWAQFQPGVLRPALAQLVERGDTQVRHLVRRTGLRAGERAVVADVEHLSALGRHVRGEAQREDRLAGAGPATDDDAGHAGQRFQGPVLLVAEAGGVLADTTDLETEVAAEAPVRLQQPVDPFDLRRRETRPGPLHPEERGDVGTDVVEGLAVDEDAAIEVHPELDDVGRAVREDHGMGMFAPRIPIERSLACSNFDEASAWFEGSRISWVRPARSVEYHLVPPLDDTALDLDRADPLGRHDHDVGLPGALPAVGVEHRPAHPVGHPQPAGRSVASLSNVRRSAVLRKSGSR